MNLKIFASRASALITSDINASHRGVLLLTFLGRRMNRTTMSHSYSEMKRIEQFWEGNL